MPAAYTHYKFGQAVLAQLAQTTDASVTANLHVPDVRLQHALSEYQDLFNIGVHGPDILFYYKALQKNPINHLGNAMHKVPARTFFEIGCKRIQDGISADATLAFLSGFICHLALDHACHSYVEYCVRSTSLSHTEVETYLDRSYLLDDGKNPLKSEITAHIRPTDLAGEVIAPLFDSLGDTTVTPKDLTTSLKQMIDYNRLLLPTNPLKEGIIRGGLRLCGKYDSLQGLIMKHSCDDDTACLIYKLRELFQSAIPKACDMILHFYDCCTSGETLDKRFDNHFDYIEELVAQYSKENFHEKTNQV